MPSEGSKTGKCHFEAPNDPERPKTSVAHMVKLKLAPRPILHAKTEKCRFEVPNDPERPKTENCHFEAPYASKGQKLALLMW